MPQLLHDQVARKAAGILDEDNADAIVLDAVEQPGEAPSALDGVGTTDRVVIPVFVGDFEAGSLGEGLDGGPLPALQVSVGAGRGRGFRDGDDKVASRSVSFRFLSRAAPLPDKLLVGQELTLERCVGKHSTSTRVIVIPKELSMKTTVLGLAASLMLAAPVLAQTTTPPAPTPPPAASPSGQPIWYSHQADEMRASKLIGTKIVNTANETIGDINEIVLGKDGKVAAVIVGVGGFLGVGEREVAMGFESIRMGRNSNNNLVLTANTSKDALKNAPEWRWDDAKK